MRSNLTGQSTETISELARKLTGKAPPRQYDANILQGCVTIRFALRQSGLGIEEFSRRHVEIGDSESGLIYKWLRGQTVPSLPKIKRIDAAINGTLALFQHPFFALLTNRPMTVKDVRRYVRQYEGSDPLGWAWRFPDEGMRISERTYVGVFGRTDTRALRIRGDLDGIAVILALVREAEALGRTADHMRFIADLYRSLPSLSVLPWFRLVR